MKNDNTVKENDEDFGFVKEEPSWTSVDLYYKGVHVKKSVPQKLEIEVLKKTIDEYLDAGFKPSWNEDTNKMVKMETPVTTSSSLNQLTTAPVCQIHQQPMIWKTGVSKTTSKPYAFWSCSLKMPDGSYCKYQPK